MMESYVEKILNGKDPAEEGKGFWNDLAVNGNLSEEDMRKYEDFFNWRKLSDHQVMSENFIREYQDMVHWDRISQRMKLSEDFLDEFRDKVTWDYVWSYQKKLSCKFIENHLSCCERVDWNRIVMYQKLDDEFIKRHIGDISPSSVMEYQKPNQETAKFILEWGLNHYKDYDQFHFKNNFYFQYCKRFQMTDEEILDWVESKAKQGWGGRGWWTILQCQHKDESFWEKHYKEIKKDQSLNVLWRKQKLSEQFLKKHIKDVDWKEIKDNKKIKKTDWIKSKLK